MELVTSTNIFFERRFEELVPLKECLKLCAASGYRKLDFGFPELSLVSKRFSGENWQEELLEYKEFGEELGLSFVQAHASIFDFCNCGADFAEREELFQRSIHGAKLLGASWVVVHPSTKVREGAVAPETHEENVAFFKKYGAFAEKVGIGLAIENMWGKTKEGLRPYALDPEELLRLVEDVNRENVRICWDVEHGSIENLDQDQALKLLAPYIAATHISDETGPDNIHILPYFGRIDWEKLLRTFAEIDYQGTLDFEIQHYLPGVPRELVGAAMKFTYEVGSYLTRRLETLKKEI